MEKRKVAKQFVDTGFGFPIKLVNVPMVNVRGVWTPDVNYNELAVVVLRALSQKRSRLTGSQIRFIRSHFEMTLQDFAKRFCVTHVAVLKWEKTEEEPTVMGWSTEKDIRLFILSKLKSKARDLAELYENLELLPLHKPAPININLAKTAA